MINSSEKCCSPFTCSSFSTVEGGRGLAWRREGGKRGGGRKEEKRGRSEGWRREKGRFKSEGS